MHLYSGPLSLFSRKIEIALAEKGIAFTRTMVPFTQTEGYAPKHETVLAANPKGQVPVLVDGNLTLYDSTVILEYLEDAFPKPALYPRDPKDRALCRQRELEADEVLLEPVRKLMFRTEPPGDAARRAHQEEEAARVMGAITIHHARVNECLAGRTYLCGSYSVADIATLLVVHWGLRLGGPTIGDHANLLAWYRRVAARPVVAAVLSEIAEADRQLSYPVATAKLP